MRDTLALLKESAPWLEVDGEMHGDIALDSAARRHLMPSSTLAGDANLLVLPNIDAANIADHAEIGEKVVRKMRAGLMPSTPFTPPSLSTAPGPNGTWWRSTMGEPAVTR